MWKHHAISQYAPRGVIVTLGGHIYREPQVSLTSATSLILEKQCCKVISKAKNIFLFMVQSEGEQKATTTIATSSQELSIQQKLVNKIVVEKIYISTSPMVVPLHYYIPHSSDLVHSASLRNGPMYKTSLLENESLMYVHGRFIFHGPFQVCLGFQPLDPIDIDIHISSSPIKSSHTQKNKYHSTIFFERT